MKRKKLQLNKTTVSNLAPRDLSAVKGGGNTEYSCYLTRLCLTDKYCNSGLEVLCDCTGTCHHPFTALFTEKPEDCYLDMKM